MSEVEIKIAYKGEAVNDGSMDVYEVASALLAIGESFQEANRELNGDTARISVRVRDKFEAGSFDIYLQIDHALLEQAKALLFPGNVKTAKDLAILLGFSVGMGDANAVTGVIHLLKLLKGMVIKSILPRPAENKVELHLENINNSNISLEFITVDTETFRLSTNPIIRRSVNRLTKPLDRPGIDRVEISEGQRMVESISKEERPYYYPVDIVDDHLVQTTSSQTSTRVAELEIVSPVFKPNNKWRLTDGNATYNVKMADDDFLRKVERHQVTFGSGDILKVLLQQTTERTPTGLKTSYTVLEVIENITPPKLPY